MIFIYLILYALFGGIASYLASKKGRNPVGWFFGGVFLGVIGIVIVAVSRDLNEDKQQARENMILKEQLRQERIKSEAFRRYSAQRLDIHDQKLGMDTRSADYQIGRDFSGQSLELASPEEIGSEGEWYLRIKGEEKGPYSFAEILDMLKKDEISSYTLVRKEGVFWKSISSIPAFSRGSDDV